MFRLGRIPKYPFTKKSDVVVDMTGRNNRLMDIHYFKYRSINRKCYQYIDEQFIFGREAYVVSTGWSSLSSTIQGLCVLDQFNFESVLLDKYNMRDLDRITCQEKQQYGHSEENLLGKSKFTTFFTNIMPNQRKYFHIYPQGIIYSVNDQTECLYFEDQLAIAYFVCDKNKRRNIILSKPDMDLFIEDLVFQLSLEEMQSIFHESLKNIEIKSQDSKLLDDQSDVLQYLLEQVKQHQGKRVFGKWTMYNASLIHKCNRIFKGSACFTDQYLCQNVVDLSQQPVLPEYDQIFRGFHAKDYPEKAKKVLNPESDQELYERALHEDKMRLIEKYVLATYLVGQDLRIQALRGQDIFSNSIFNGKLNKDDIETYLLMHSKYGDFLQKTQNKILMSFEDSIKARKFINSYSQQIEKIEKKANEHEYKYDIHGFSKLKSQLALATAFHAQMDNIIKQRQEVGITQFETLQSLKQIKEGNFSEQSLRQYIQLLHDTNVSLGYPLKFPRMLAPITMSYVSNNERLRLADQYAYQDKPRIIEGLEILHESGLTNKPEPSIAHLLREREKDFSDEEETPKSQTKDKKKENMEELQFQKFVLGAPDTTSKFPHDISKLSEEELIKMGFKVVGRQDVTIKNGEIISDHDLDPDVVREIKEFMKKS